MPWKTNENGQIVIDESSKNPVWLDDAGKESPVDYEAMRRKLGEVTGESMKRKDQLKNLEAKYGKFADIEDLDAWHSEATKALEALKAMPDKDKAIEEQLQARLEAATKPLKDQLGTLSKEKEQLWADFQREAVANSFSRSSFVNNKLANAALAADLFAKNFALKDGKVVALGEDGQPVYGGEGGYASFDEALAVFVEKSPYKDVLLQGSPGSGSGAAPGNGGHSSSPAGKKYTDLKTKEEKAEWLKANAV